MRYALFIPLLFASQAWSAVACDPVDMERLEKEIHRIDERYDDFFEYQAKREKHEKELQKGVDEVKQRQEIRAKELERARQAYRAEKKDYAKEEAMRIQWEAAQKDKAKQMELARLCEVQQRAKAEAVLKRGRKIPELKEFDLED